MIEPALRKKRLLPYPWVWDYLPGQWRSRRIVRHVDGPVHLMFLFVDHYEPEDQVMVDRWVHGYPAVARTHRDADGRPPQYGWFWYFPEASPADEARYLRSLSELAFGGWGEVELHLHHDNDTAETLTADLERRLTLSNEFGAMLTAQETPQRRYGFIHGMWALDNSRLGKYCGVNNELQVLKATGCYADFTMAAWGPMQSRWVNRIYMATDDPMKPKSYDIGTPVRVGCRPNGDLLIMQGPTVLHLDQLWKRHRPIYDHGDITQVEPPSPWRLDRWVKQWIHVEGRPEWIFVKVYTHGAVPRDVETLLGPSVGGLFTDLEQRYNDGQRFVLHYVTAREAYNIIQAAADGRTGNPNAYRDYRIPPPVNRFLQSSSRVQVRVCQPGQSFAMTFMDAGIQELFTNAWLLRSARGAFSDIACVERAEERQADVKLRGTGPILLGLGSVPRRVTSRDGAQVSVEGQTVQAHIVTGRPLELSIAW